MATPEALPRMLTMREAAAILRRSVNTTYGLAAAGVIPSVRLGRSVRIPADALQRWIEDNTRGGRPEAK